MLNIINNLKPFIEDNYRRINVREYARIAGISPPTASKLLEQYKRKNLLKKEKDRIYNFYFANKDSQLFIDISRMYWRQKLSGLIEKLENELSSPVIILFGSLSKAETKKGSDVDIAVFTPTKKTIDLEPYERSLKRKIQLMLFKEKADSKELMNNILNGYKISGSW